LLVVDKPQGLTSHDVVARIRRLIKQRRVGHCGTLDPAATGVLVLCLGEATRLASFLSDRDKHYRATAYLGIQTDTQDASGQAIRIADSSAVNTISESAIQAALAKFHGWIDQVPPMVSAKHHHGVRLHTLARRGETIPRAPVRVKIVHLEYLELHDRLLMFDIMCSKGTYVRTLVDDLGLQLGIGAHLAELRRTGSGSFTLTDAAPLDALDSRERIIQHMLPPLAAVQHLPWLHLVTPELRRFQQGQRMNVQCSAIAGTTLAILDQSSKLIGIATWKPPSTLQPRIVLSSNNL
jgi:tRNA pseudouridine55 synthase